MDNPSDQQIIDRVLDGDTDAFALLMRRYQSTVMGRCYRATRNMKDAEDLTQEVFLRVFRALSSFRPGMPFGPWLYRITMNRILTFLRKRAESRELVYETEAIDRPVAPAQEDILMAHETMEQLDRRIQEMPEHYRAVFVMRHFMDMSYEDMAAATGHPIGTVKAHLFRARHFLSQFDLNPHGEPQT